MSITKTFEPLRPLACRGDHEADYHWTLGQGRTFYGESHWPSRSYQLWQVEEAREALYVHTGIAVSR